MDKHKYRIDATEGHDEIPMCQQMVTRKARSMSSPTCYGFKEVTTTLHIELGAGASLVNAGKTTSQKILKIL